MVNRTPKKIAKQAEPEYRDIYGALEHGSSEIEPENKGPDLSGQLSELMKRVDQLSADNLVLRSQQMQPQQVQQVVQQSQQTEQAPEMPDPILNPTGHAKWLEDRLVSKVTKLLADQQATAQQVQQSTSAYDQLWDTFVSQPGNEAWMDEPEKVQVAALKVTKAAKARGLDPEKYMLQNRDMFFKDLSSTLEADFGKPGGDDDEADEGDVDGDDVDRTAGIASGQQAPISKPAAGSKGAPDMFGDLTSIQRKGGWY